MKVECPHCRMDADAFTAGLLYDAGNIIPDHVAPGVLELSCIPQQDLNALAGTVAQDVRKTEAEPQE